MRIVTALKTSWSVHNRRKVGYHAVLESLEGRSLLSSGGTPGEAEVLTATPRSAPEVAPLANSGDPSTFTFAVMGDSHVGKNSGSEKRFQFVADEIMSEGVALVLSVGDQTDSGKPGQFDEWKETWDYAWTNYDRKPAPTILAAIGNHDLNLDKTPRWKSFKDAFPDFQYTPGDYHQGKPSGSTNTYPIARLSKVESDLSYSFSYDNVEFVGLDEYQSGGPNDPKLSPDDYTGLKELKLPAGTASTVVFGHVPDWNPTKASKGHPEWLPGTEAKRFFQYDIDHDMGLYYFAGHDHGYYPGLPIKVSIPASVTVGKSSIAIKLGAHTPLREVVSAAGGQSATEAFALVNVSGGKIDNVTEVYWNGKNWTTS